ncbi:D-alanyl-D-alanine carboxypeptidase [Pseudoalteromonas denitrificans DSM 6059]|uniref:D-alanyl-D-alanine carboxypeptidase n=2 Tax=Pseudoalteromonas TaxID=53246 RepID=A0A1I1NCA7_9GAMM|nr:D-alanyl-D-alanine carboxypeptidase [Pseudoalteromonas denitrificans DSM 6059]
MLCTFLLACIQQHNSNDSVPSQCVKNPVQCKEGTELDYQALLNNLISEAIPGVTLFVETPSAQFKGSAGLADIENKIAMTPDTLMPNGSAGKKLTALLIAMLHDEGLLNLDAPISRYLSQDLLIQIQYSDLMTLRMLLNHTSGIFEYNDSGDYALYKAQFSDPSSLKTDLFFLKFALNMPGYFKPGTHYAYSNSNYALAGLILDRILKQHHSKAVRNKILDPLNMQHSYYKAIEKHKYDIASGYFINNEEENFPTPLYQRFNTKTVIENTRLADAPLASSSPDMAKLLKAIIANKSFINDDIRENLIGAKRLIEIDENNFYRASKIHYGLGIFIETINETTFYHHAGNEFGYYTQNIYIPTLDVSITAMVNCGVFDECDAPFNEMVFKILESFLNVTNTTKQI